MAISNDQKIDYLWKKIGYGRAKTDTAAIKDAVNESISSALLLRGDNVWAQSNLIPTTIPGSSTSVVTLYPTSLPVECTADTTSSTNRTWKTNITDWVPPEIGSTYLVKVYVHTSGNAATAAASGTQLVAAGSGNNDEWFFDYQSGTLNFIGTNLPSGVNFTGKSVYISGAVYSGIKGVPAVGSANTFTNLDLTGNLNVSGVSTFVGGIRGIGIQSGSVNIATGIITALNFVGSGNSISYNAGTKVVDISIGGGNWEYENPTNTYQSDIYRLNGNVGIGTIDPTSKLDVRGDVNVTGIVTATVFVGDGSGLTGITASGSGIIIRDSGILVGTAGTIDFGDNLTVSTISAGVVTVTSSGGGASSQWVSNPTGIHTFSSVGIATTNPTSTFTVVGNVLISGVTTSGGYNATTGNDYKINGTSVLTATTLGSGVVNSSLTSVGTLSSGLNIDSGQTYKINNTNVLDATTLGSGVVNSSLTSVGTLTRLVVAGVTTSGGYNATTGNDYKINGTSVLTATTLGSGVVNSSLTSIGTLSGGLNIASAQTYKINNTEVLSSTTLGSGVVNSSLTSIGTLLGGLNIDSGQTYKINNTNVLDATTLGSGVVNSSLTSVGTLTSLNVSGTTTLAGIATVTGTTLFSRQLSVSGIVTTGTHNLITGNTYQIAGVNVLSATTLGANVVTSSLTSVGTLSGGLNIASGQTYRVNGTAVLDATTLGSSVTASSLTSVGTLTSLNVTGIVTASSFSGNATSATSATTATTATTASQLSFASSSSPSTRYLVFTDTLGGNSEANVNSELQYVPSTGNLSATQFTSLSDATKKKNVRPIENSIELTKQLQGVRFDWINNDKPSLGLIAQDVEKVLPELVETNGDGIKSVSYSNMIGVLIEAIKEQQIRIEELERKLNA